MTTTRILLTLLLALATALPAQSAPPRGGGGGGGYRGGGGYHGGHNHGGTRWVVGVNVGYPGFGYWGGYYPWYGAGYYPYYPYYPYNPYYPAYYPGPAVQQQPMTYTEQPAPQAQQQAPTGYWYYCADPGAYYPYIKECPAGWQRVAPQPSN